MAHQVVRNPIPYVSEINPEPKLTPGQKAINRRIAKLEAQRAREDSMPVPSNIIQDLNPGVKHQTKAMFTPAAPGKPAAKTVPPRPANPIVQRVQRPVEQAQAEPSILDELHAELGGPIPDQAQAPVQSQPDEADADVDGILSRFKGSDSERLKALAKSYKESEKRMRHLENERKLFTNGQPAQPAQPQAQPVQATQQVSVTPTFDYKRVKDRILDEPDAILQDFEKHIVGKSGQALANILNPVVEEVLNMKLQNKFPDVVNEDNLDIIKAMAHNEVGQNPWEKLVSAANKYKATTTGNLVTKPNQEVQDMQAATQTPSPQARTSGEKKMWKESQIRAEMAKKMKTGEYQRDHSWRNLIDTAYREGRVLRGQ
jgi:hypothetical protein